MNILKLCFLIVAVLTVGAIGFMGCSGNGAKVTSLAATPTNPVISAQSTATTIPTAIPLTYNAIAILSDGTSLPYWQLVTWSSDPSVATISSTPGSIGLVTPNAGLTSNSTITVTATYIDHPNISATSSLTVVASTLLSYITVTTTNLNPSISSGTTTLQFTASWNGGSPDITKSVSWSSSNPGVASISNTSGANGFATLVYPGQTTITATDLYTSPPVTGTVIINVYP